MKQIQLQNLDPSDLSFCWSILESWSIEDRIKNGFAQSSATIESFIQDYGGYCVRLDPTANQNIDTRCGFCFIRPIGEACEIGKAGEHTHSVKIAEILLIAVHEKLSRLGLGTMIMKAIIDDLQKRQFHEVWLEVHAENQRAIALYQKVGFVVTSKRPKYYPDGADALNLKLAFNVPA